MFQEQQTFRESEKKTMNNYGADYVNKRINNFDNRIRNWKLRTPVKQGGKK